MAGLPGTGLGGIFYALLVLVVVAREIALMVRSRSTPERRRTAVRLLAMLTVMAAVFWAEGYALKQLIDAVNATRAIGLALHLPEAIVPELAWTPFILLAGVLAGVKLLKLRELSRR